MTRTVYLGIGTNIGHRRRNIRSALRSLSGEPGLRVVRVSPLYETSPVGPRQRNFFNIVVRAVTAFSPPELLARLQRIEAGMGRRPGGKRWGPRIIDIDILFYGRLVVRKRNVRIPHPGIEDRRFVLEPLTAISPRLVHPLRRKTVRKLRDKLLLTGTEQKVTMVERIFR